MVDRQQLNRIVLDAVDNTVASKQKFSNCRITNFRHDPTKGRILLKQINPA